MNENVLWELRFVLISLMFGLFYSLVYDCIRILRRIVVHKRIIFIAIEDIIFWIFVGISVFSVTFEENNGIVRAFSIGCMAVGAIIYRYSVGMFLVKYVSLFLIKPLKKYFKYITMKFKGNFKGKFAHKRKDEI